MYIHTYELTFFNTIKEVVQSGITMRRASCSTGSSNHEAQVIAR